ncbi:Myosin-8 [Zea mays]|uniref:Myosin-8 n=1 Tax=Zea mays TaxID=4577 RepID=A0A3L6DYS2_MAIZE|nr:Myosin-8 [Zea mays]
MGLGAAMALGDPPADYASIAAVGLFVALRCVRIVVGHLLEENRWMNESITTLFIHLENGFHEVEELKENVDALIECVGKNLGYCAGKPVAAITIYKCLLHWKSFEADKTSVFNRLIHLIGSAIECLMQNEDNNDNLAYCLSNTSSLLFLLQRSLKVAGAPGSVSRKKPPQPTSLFGRMAQCKAFWEVVSASLGTFIFVMMLSFRLQCHTGSFVVGAAWFLVVHAGCSTMFLRFLWQCEAFWEGHHHANLKSSVTTTASAVEYRDEELKALPPGVNGCSLKTKENLEVLRGIPVERLMIETYSLYCDIINTHAGSQYVKSVWPSKKKDKHEPDLTVKGRNEPCLVRQVLEVVAGSKGISDIEGLSRTLYHNTCRLFFP